MIYSACRRIILNPQLNVGESSVELLQVPELQVFVTSKMSFETHAWQVFHVDILPNRKDLNSNADICAKGVLQNALPCDQVVAIGAFEKGTPLP